MRTRKFAFKINWPLDYRDLEGCTLCFNMYFLFSVTQFLRSQNVLKLQFFSIHTIFFQKIISWMKAYMANIFITFFSSWNKEKRSQVNLSSTNSSIPKSAYVHMVLFLSRSNNSLYRAGLLDLWFLLLNFFTRTNMLSQGIFSPL